MDFATGVFLVVALFSVGCLIFWKKKIDPDGGSFWIYLVWVLFCNILSFFLFNPWGVLG